MRAGPGRLKSIDALRGLAALLVFLTHEWPLHLDGGGPVDRLSAFLRMWLLHEGRTGVLLFFIISGFVVPWSLCAHQDAPLRRFWASRMARLYPAYWLSLALGAALPATPLAGSTLLINITMLQHILGHPDVIGVYWTLAVEMAFYVLAVVLFLSGVLARPRQLGLLVAVAAAGLVVGGALHHFGGLELPVGTCTFLTLMLFGTWLRLGHPDRRQVTLATLALLAALLATCWLFYGPERFGRPWTAHFSAFVLAVGGFVLLRQARWLEWRPLVWLGEISYSVYLFHEPLSNLVARYGPAAPLARFVLSMLLTFLVSAMLYRLVEQPCVHGGRVLAGWLVRIGRRPQEREA